MYHVHFCLVKFDVCMENVSGRHGRDHMVVGFTTTCVISAYHH